MLRFVFMGKPHDFSLAPLRRLLQSHQLAAIVESGERPEMRRGFVESGWPRLRRRVKDRLRPSALQSLARSHRVPYLRLNASRMPELLPFVRLAAADVICVASLTCLLKPDVLAAARFGAINLHPSLLPRYPGPYPWFWQYHDAQRQMGVTVHRIDVGEDTGDILTQSPMNVALGCPLQEAMSRAIGIGAELMVQAVDGLEKGTLNPRPNPSHQHPKARMVRRDEWFIRWQDWPLERVWHYLQAAPLWTDELRRIAHAGAASSVSVLEFRRMDSSEPPGRLRHEAGRTYITHPQGRIYIRVRSRGARLIADLARRARTLSARP